MCSVSIYIYVYMYIYILKKEKNREERNRGERRWEKERKRKRRGEGDLEMAMGFGSIFTKWCDQPRVWRDEIPKRRLKLRTKSVSRNFISKIPVMCVYIREKSVILKENILILVADVYFRINLFHHSSFVRWDDDGECIMLSPSSKINGTLCKNHELGK